MFPVILADDAARDSVLRTAGPLALLFVVLLGLALFFLLRSLNRQLKKVDPALPEGPDDRLRHQDERLQAEAVEQGAHEQPPGQ